MKKIIIISAVVIALLVAEYFALLYYRTSSELTITHKNVSSAALYKKNNDGDDRVVKKNIDSGNTVRIDSMSRDYYIAYEGSEGYADGEIDVEYTDSKVDIQPVLSTDKLAEIYPGEKAAITKALHGKYPDLKDLYDIKSDRLYQHGDWFGAALIYKGKSFVNRDNVGVVMQKQDNRWVVITDPPMPSVNIYHQPAIPLDVAEGINKTLHG